MSEIYAVADREIEALRRYISAEFQNTVNLLRFDEMNLAEVKSIVTALYKRLAARNLKVFQTVAESAYEEAQTEAHKLTGRKGDDFVAYALVMEVLTGYNPVTGYVYKNEIERKMERAIEGIYSARNRKAMETSLGIACRLWFNQTRLYVDYTLDFGRLEALRDCGVKHVRWVAHLDHKTCDECHDRHGEIYEIDKVPDKAHPNCRCYLEPVD